MSNKKILENPFVSSLVVPIAIVLFGALIIFGVTKMLSTERSYKDLVNELHSKTFGNRWIAAYELSKMLNTKSIPPEDEPWLVEELSTVYQNAVDPRTRQFIIVALGAMKNIAAVPVIEQALDDKDPAVKFRALVSIGNFPKGISLNWDKVKTFLSSDDHALQHSAILSLATHQIEGANNDIAGLLKSDRKGVAHAAATALVYFQDERALPYLKDILFMTAAKPGQGFDEAQVFNLKMNVLMAQEKIRWDALNKNLNLFIEKEENNKLIMKAKSILNLLKN